MTFTTKKYLATVTTSIATRSSRPPGRYWDKGDGKNEVVHTTGLDRGRNVYIIHTRTTIDKLPVSKLHYCNIGNWDCSKESRNSAVGKPHVDTRRETSFGGSEKITHWEDRNRTPPNFKPAVNGVRQDICEETIDFYNLLSKKEEPKN